MSTTKTLDHLGVDNFDCDMDCDTCRGHCEMGARLQAWKKIIEQGKEAKEAKRKMGVI